MPGFAHACHDHAPFGCSDDADSLGKGAAKLGWHGSRAQRFAEGIKPGAFRGDGPDCGCIWRTKSRSWRGRYHRERATAKVLRSNDMSAACSGVGLMRIADQATRQHVVRRLVDRFNNHQSIALEAKDRKGCTLGMAAQHMASQRFRYYPRSAASDRPDHSRTTGYRVVRFPAFRSGSGRRIWPGRRRSAPIQAGCARRKNGLG